MHACGREISVNLGMSGDNIMDTTDSVVAEKQITSCVTGTFASRLV